MGEGKRLKNAHLLGDDIRNWAPDDPTGTVGMQAETIATALATAEADYQRAVEELKDQALH